MAEDTNAQPEVINSNGYTAEDIQVLGGREAVRRRPGMYIGSTDQRGLHHLIYEIVYNSIDEAMAGCCDKIQVTIQENGVIVVEDNGRGIPVGHSRRCSPSHQCIGTGDGNDHPSCRS
jgi:DNA gyrase subunit B